MKNSLRCPKCSGTRLLHLTQIADTVGEYGSNITTEPDPVETRSSHPWRIARVPVPEEERRWWKVNELAVGLVEAWICRACGYTELYTKQPDAIPVDGEIVRAIDGPPSAGPLR